MQKWLRIGMRYLHTPPLDAAALLVATVVILAAAAPAARAQTAAGLSGGATGPTTQNAGPGRRPTVGSSGAPPQAHRYNRNDYRYGPQGARSTRCPPTSAYVYCIE